MNSTETVATRSPRPVAGPRWARRAWPLAAAILIAGAGLTGCGDSGGTSSAASSAPAGSGGGGAGAAGGGSTKAVKYAECMRKNGVPEFPDPAPDGRVMLTGKKGSGLDPESPQFKAAQQACKAFAPQGAVGGGRPDPAMLKFSQCMRKNGVPNFPDPSGGKLLMKQGSGIDPNSPQFQAAQKTCQKLLPGGTQ
ncbi:hypothetical protein NE236_29015 [Actinoallomurus purpureus]|uniref:hypothetical protein n=1 Tax=Actinoallomurus purpureus TaxID=478114 RepID=UPI0020921145|nr:hypothetical protein [Actinoallomurus purpureus]MCO6009022.1 hypothetical protein [Actinoallomurus purpureus]